MSKLSQNSMNVPNKIDQMSVLEALELVNLVFEGTHGALVFRELSRFANPFALDVSLYQICIILDVWAKLLPRILLNPISKSPCQRRLAHQTPSSPYP